MEKKGRIGIPRALMFYRYIPLWKGFFEALGWEVAVSEGLGRNGKILCVEDSCLPMKLLVTHALHLAEDVDHLFIPRLISLHPKYIMCPKFRGAPDIVRLAMKRGDSVLDETIDLRVREHSSRKALLKVGERLGGSPQETRKAYSRAEQSQLAFQAGWVERVNRLPTRDLFRLDLQTPVSPGVFPSQPEGSTALRVAFVGHPYNLFDLDINKDVLGLAKSLGIEIVTSDLLSEAMIERRLSALSKDIYWSSGREIVGSLFHFLAGGVDGVVFVTSFKCGIDALLQEFVKRITRTQGEAEAPFLVLTFDEHTGREGTLTRLEAFRDVIEERKRQELKDENPIPDESQ